MAFYQCFVPVGSLDVDTRAAAAEAITTVHSAVIGVPREDGEAQQAHSSTSESRAFAGVVVTG